MSVVRTFADLDSLTRVAADEIVALAAAAIAERGRCHLALSGGSTPRRLFQHLAARPGDLPWDKVELWWGDERCVPPDHADSNYGAARALLIEPLRRFGLVDERVHRIHGELDPGASARAYEDELAGALGTPPVLDIALQGMGPDGHTASLFPDSPALDETRHWVVANPVKSPLVPGGAAMRITLTAPAINHARRVRFLAAGADKAESLAAVLEGPREPRRYPAQLIEGPDVVWLVDTAAAARLGGRR
jgi:6-phosphogluconolactonase